MYVYKYAHTRVEINKSDKEGNVGASPSFSNKFARAEKIEKLLPVKLSRHYDLH